MNKPDLLSPKAADRISQLLVVLMMGFAAAAIYIPVQNAQVARAIERAARFEIGFSGQDAKIAVALLNQDIARYRIEPTPERAAAAQVDYAVLAGRGKDFRHGEFGAFVARSPKPGAEVAEFDATMAQLDPLVAGITQGHNAARAAELAQKLEQPIQLLASQALIANSENASARQEQLRGQQLQTILLTIGLLITSCGLIVMLDRQNKFVRKTHLKQIEATKKYEFLASHDPLTGLPNRARFGQALSEALASLGAPGREVALLTVDLDRFKTINDTLGHSAGDTLLVFVARRLERLTKMQPGALVARVGGDEFLALVEGEGVEKQATDLAAAALEALCEPYALDGRSIVVHASVGIAIAPTHGANVGDLITNSDAALHRAKRAGRGVACLFREDMDEEARERKALRSDLAQSIERDEFEPHYQPVIQFAGGGIVGVEALARWRLPTRSGTQASIFLPLAEETGAIASLGRRILEIACLDAAAMPPHFHIAVNVSPVQFLRGDIVETVKQALALSGLPASRLQLEFGESVLLTDEDYAQKAMNELRSLGVGLALDDFGAGYSSLAHLRRRTFDTLKIDRSLIFDIDRDPQRFEMVQTIATLGRSLGMKIVAEGIETAEQARIARLAGCELGQGYFFARPMAANELAVRCGWVAAPSAQKIA